jgi:hypothetical protein
MYNSVKSITTKYFVALTTDIDCCNERFFLLIQEEEEGSHHKKQIFSFL